LIDLGSASDKYFDANGSESEAI